MSCTQTAFRGVILPGVVCAYALIVFQHVRDADLCVPSHPTPMRRHWYPSHLLLHTLLLPWLQKWRQDGNIESKMQMISTSDRVKYAKICKVKLNFN